MISKPNPSGKAGQAPLGHKPFGGRQHAQTPNRTARAASTTPSMDPNRN